MTTTPTHEDTLEKPVSRMRRAFLFLLPRTLPRTGISAPGRREASAKYLKEMVPLT